MQINYSLESQKLLLDIQCTAQFASKNIHEDYIQKNVVGDLYSLVEKLHLSLKNLELNSTPKLRG